MASPAPAYRFSELGWLQFERLCELIVRGADGSAPHWLGHADEGRIGLLEPGTRITVDTATTGPATVVVLWARERPESASIPEVLGDGVARGT